MSRQARLGLVILVGLVAAAAFLFVIAGQSNLLSRKFGVRAAFNDVAGLQNGASVFYNGVSVGRVEAIQLPSSPGDPITVRMSVDEKVRPLIRQDSKAKIETDGLVGNMIVSLSAGSRTSPTVAEGGQIRSEEPFQISAISDRLFESVARFDSVTVSLAGIMGDVRGGEGSLGRFLYDDALYNATVSTTEEFQTTLGTFTTRADALVAIAEDASRGLESILNKVDNGEGTLSQFLNDDQVYNTFLATAAELQGAAAQFQTISADVRNITDRFNQSAGWAALGAFRFSENMEALKHNFLFKSYFEDRGYFEMAPFEVREEAIAETLEDLQDWERRLYRQQRDLDEAQAEIEQLRTELERRGVSVPANSTPTPVSPSPVLGGQVPDLW
jgi:phospholipid/cholesterol/gamma-HCH transport system substrate-binding protein